MSSNQRRQQHNSSQQSNLLTKVVSVVTTAYNVLFYLFNYTQKHYSGSPITITQSKGGESKGETFVCLRTGRRDRYVLVDTSVDFLIFHRHHHLGMGYRGGLPDGFKVYRVTKGWFDGFFGWGWSSVGGRSKKGWDDVTPHIELKVKETSTNVVYGDASGTHAIEPSRRVTRDANIFDPAIIGVEEELNSVTHMSIHIPLTTADGFYRFVIMDPSGDVIATTPDYTLHSSFTSFGILQGSTIAALPIQFVGFFVKNIIAAFVSGLLTVFYFSGIASIGGIAGIAMKLFMWIFKDQIADAERRAARFMSESGVIKPLDYLARAAGGGLPGSSYRFVEYERQWERTKKDDRTGKGYLNGGGWVVKNIDRSVFNS